MNCTIRRYNYQLMWYYARRWWYWQWTDENLSNWFSHGPDALDPHEIIEPINWKRRNCFRPILLLLGKEILITAELNRNSREYCRIINGCRSWRDCNFKLHFVAYYIQIYSYCTFNIRYAYQEEAFFVIDIISLRQFKMSTCPFVASAITRVSAEREK